MSNPKSPEELAADLAQFSGTEGYFRYWLGISLLTDGVKYLADQAGCYWLLDAIGSYQPELAKHPDERLHEMQFWLLKIRIRGQKPIMRNRRNNSMLSKDNF